MSLPDKVVLFRPRYSEWEVRLLNHPAHLKNILRKHFKNDQDITEAYHKEEIKIFELKEVPMQLTTSPVLQYGDDMVKL